MGHHSHNGGAWSDDYYVVDAEAFAGSPDSQRAYVHRVKEIAHDGNIVFPVKEGTLLPADPVDRASAKVEGSTVLRGETGPSTGLMGICPMTTRPHPTMTPVRGATLRAWRSPMNGPSGETILFGCITYLELHCSFLRRRWTHHLFLLIGLTACA